MGRGRGRWSVVGCGGRGRGRVGAGGVRVVGVGLERRATTHPRHTTTSTTKRRSARVHRPPRPTSTHIGHIDHDVGPDGDGELPVVVCQTTSGVTTTTTALPGSASVRVPASDARQGNLAVYSDEAGRLMVVGPTVGWTCTGSFGADGSGIMALAPVGTTVPVNSGTTWHLPAVVDSGDRGDGERWECGAGRRTRVPRVQFREGGDATEPREEACTSDPAQERVSRISSVAVGFQDPPGVAGIGFPSGGQNPANGVALYQPKPTEATAYLVTCTLAVAQHDLCAAVLNQFSATFG